jgi:phage terminase large subunit-like protein
VPRKPRLVVPPRFPEVLPRGPQLWDPSLTGWSEANTDGLFACELIESYLRLTKGVQRGQLVRLRLWQGDLICDVLRLDPATGKRQYWTYLLLIPRKNSKSLMGAGLAIDGLFDEPGAEVYSCAADEKQAKIIFNEVKAAVEMSPELDAKQGGLLRVFRDVIEYPANGSIYRALSSEAFTKEGLNPSRVLFDELHAQPNAELWNVMNQGSDTRDQPLVLAISTFGVKTDSTGDDSICFKQYQYAKRLMSGELQDPHYGARIYETSDNVPGFNHLDRKHWYAANPALGDFLQEEKMAAITLKIDAGDFKTKRLNIWVNTKRVSWLPDGAWDEREDAEAQIEAGATVCLGFDGSYDNDSTALVVVRVPDELPASSDPDQAAPSAEEIAEHAAGQGLRLPHIDVVNAWEKPPKADEGWTVPIAEVEQAIRDACKRWNVREIDCDPARWARSYQALEEEGLPVVEFPQTPARMVPATARFFQAVMNKGLTHSGDPRLARHIGNCTKRITSRGVMVSKDTPKSPRKIDLGVAAIIAFERACQPPPKKPEPAFYSWDEL